MKIDAKSLDEYLSKTGEYEPQLRQLDQIIRDEAPNLKQVYMNTQTVSMIGYGMMPYQPKSAKVASEWPLVALAAQKNYMALYVCAVDLKGGYVAEKQKLKLGKVSVGKSCIRFKKLEDLNLETVKNILKDLDKRFVSGEKLFG